MTELRLGYYILEGGHGYAAIGKELKAALGAAGAATIPKDQTDWDLLVAFSPPAGFLVGPHTRPDVCFHTMIEVNALPANWVTLLNRVGLVWVPSAFCQDVFEGSGVTTPIIRSPYGVRGTPVRRSVRDGTFRVLAWGDTFFSRKNIELTIQAFIAADLKDAELDVKLNLDGISLPVMRWTDEHGHDHPNVTIRHGNWSQAMLNEWMRSGDVGIYLSSGEGYGLMPKEQMASGLPLISVLHTGLTEYLNEQVILPVVSRLEPIRVPLNNAYTGACHYMPDLESAITQLRWAYHHREELSDLGMTGASHVLQWTWERAGTAAYAQIAAWCDAYGRSGRVKSNSEHTANAQATQTQPACLDTVAHTAPAAPLRHDPEAIRNGT
jgi:glycosyltransferase involved in cell wall biosynthesis